MNFKSTLALLIVAAAGGIWYWFGPEISARLGWSTPPAASSSQKILDFLKKDLEAGKLTRIEVQRGSDPKVILERGSSGEWSLPGNWPTRQEETSRLVNAVTHLHSRFIPLELGQSGDWNKYGLDPSQRPTILKIQTGDKSHRLTLGEGVNTDTGDPFNRPTYLRIDDEPEVVRLAPGLVEAIKTSPDYYQKRRLIPAFERARVTTSEMPPPTMPGMPPTPRDQDKTVELFDGQELTVELSEGTYTLKRTGVKTPRKADVALTGEQLADEWEIEGPSHDRPDDKRLESILTAVPNIWAERFPPRPKQIPLGTIVLAPTAVESLPASSFPTAVCAAAVALMSGEDWYLYETGLEKPEATLKITGANGGRATLLVGKPVPGKRPRFAPPPPDSPFPAKLGEDRFRYAKLQGNDQVFEIKADPVEKNLFVAVADLRDARLARFQTEDVQRLDIKQDKQQIALVKENHQWKIEKPISTSAENGKVTELLDKLSHLEARGEDVSYQVKPEQGLDKPTATIRIEVKGTGGEGAKRPDQTLTFALGRHDTSKAKVYVRVDDRPRVNAVDDSILALANRPVLAYRGRVIFDASASDLAKIEIQRGEEKVVLEQSKDTWRLTAPVQADADQSKSNQAASTLGRMEAVEFVNEDPKPADLDKLYGLARPAASATLIFSKAEKPAQTLLLGKQREGKNEYFAKLTSGPAVFAVNKDVHDTLTSGSLAYRPLQLWQVPTDELAEIRVQKTGQAYRLKREGLNWRIVEPFEAPALASLVQPLATDLGTLRVERYESHSAKELKPYGLDQPPIRVEVKSAAKKEGDKPKDHVLLIGKATSAGASTRFAKLAGSDAVVVLGDKLATSVDGNALDLLDRNLLTLDLKTVTQFQSKADGSSMTLHLESDGWRVKTPGAEAVADSDVMAEFLKTWQNLRAEKFAAYGPKADPAAYGLDKPVRTITITVKPADADKNAVKEHTVVVGKPVPEDPQASYARVDNGPGIVILGPAPSTELKRDYLDFVDRKVWTLDETALTAIRRQMTGNDLELAKRDDTWQVVKPVTFTADTETIDSVVAGLAALKAERFAAYPAKDLKPFGLDSPAAQVTLSLSSKDGKPQQHVIRIGKTVDDGKGVPGSGRYAAVDDSKNVIVLSGYLADQLLSRPLGFRDKNLARFIDADRVTMDRGTRHVVFTKVNGTWKVTSPIEADAEQADMEDFINGCARLRADQLVAEKPADLKPFGLDKPEIAWRFQSGDKEVLGLLIGKHETRNINGQVREIPRCYAKLSNGDVVFLLDARMTRRAPGEYRSRSIWAPVDAAQVETLRYGNGSQSFTLEKSGTAWRVAGKPDAMVKTEAVTETLDALARLKVERYVVDKEADLKLYGLEPPVLVVEIQTPSGKRLLHIGRAEGESKRRYARAPEANRSDVFTIAEADAGKIVRELGAFLKK
jgi:hypothetical protein